MQNDNPLHPCYGVVAQAPASVRPLLQPLLRGLAIDEISRVEASAADIGSSMLETVENDSLAQNTPENTRENTGSPGDPVISHPVAAAIGPARARDAALLLLIVQLRVASIQQLAKVAFPNVSIVVARRRIRALQRDGWVRTWDRPVPSGGAPRYVYPTSKALRWAFLRLLELARGSAAERLVRLMIPDSTKRLVQLGDGVEPQWFAHQDEINRLVISRLHAAGERMVWASAWDCPFPDRLNGLKAPQPDYVLVTSDERAVPVLTFGEHDRATEPIARWNEKLAAYAFARELSEDLFGHSTFMVDVSVVDPVGRNPLRRIKAIAEAARASGCLGFVRLTLGGWLHGLAQEPIWFSEGAVPEVLSLKPGDHANVSA
jgi:hypothetical protein